MNLAQRRHYLNIKDPGSAITHFIGFIMAVVATPFLIGKMIRIEAGIPAIISCTIFGISMMALYLASTLYHTIITQSLIPKKIDHMMVFILIAGTYTPVCINILGKTGIKILIAVWTFAILGFIFTVFFVTCPKWVSSVIYVAMGWTCIFALPSIVHNTSPVGFLWLLMGGILYSIGAVIYALKPKLFNEMHPNFGTHEIFHIFVMLGTFCHYIFIYFFVI